MVIKFTSAVNVTKVSKDQQHNAQKQIKMNNVHFSVLHEDR